MTRPMPKLSIVCPAFNEEEVLPHFHKELLAVVDCLGHAWDAEILYVDDGSRDGTLLHLRRWARTDARVRYLSFSRNFGHQAAMSAGMEHARGDAIITLDTDLQHPPDVIPTLVEKWREGYEIVVTNRSENPDFSLARRHGTHLFYFLMQILTRAEVRASVSDYRLMSRKAVDALLRMPERNRFLRGMIQWLGFPTTEVTFTVAPRAAGRSKFTFTCLLASACDAMLSFSRLPLRLPLYLGLAFGLGGLSVAGAGLLRWFLGLSSGEGMATLMLAELNLVGGAILCSLGVVGEYLARVFDQVRGRPLYLVKETEKDLAAEAGKSAGPRKENAVVRPHDATAA